MPTPGAYYDMLPRRLVELGVNQVEEDINTLRKLEILVDGQADRRYMLQIFMKEAAALFKDPQAGPHFIELLQRKGDDGFGGGNFRALFESIERQQQTEARVQSGPRAALTGSCPFVAVLYGHRGRDVRVEGLRRSLRQRSPPFGPKHDLVRASWRDVEIVVVWRESRDLQDNRQRQAACPQSETPVAIRRRRGHGLEADLRLLVRRDAAREVERLASNGAGREVDQGGDGYIVSWRPEAIGVGRVEEAIEQVRGPQARRATTSDRHGRLHVGDMHLAGPQ